MATTYAKPFSGTLEIGQQYGQAVLPYNWEAMLEVTGVTGGPTVYTVTYTPISSEHYGPFTGSPAILLRTSDSQNRFYFGDVYGPPTKATNPTPANAATNVTLDQQTISWENGGGATSYNVYYGTESGNLTLLESGVTDTSYTIFQISNGSPFDYTVTRYWRIDSVNANGTTTGDEWSFTTITFAAPPAGGRGGTGGTGGGTVADGQSNIKTRLVAFARNKVFYEDG